MYDMTKLQALNTSIPIFLKKNLIYLRKEKNNLLSFYANCGYTNELIMNNTSLMILKLCDSNRNVEDIVNYIHFQYSTISKEKIENDVYQTLLNFEKIQLIKWKEGNPIMMLQPVLINETYNLHVASETDIRDICKFLSENHESNKLVFWSNSIPSNFNKEINIRYHLFSRKGDYFLVKDNNNKLCGIIFIAVGNQIRNPVAYVEFCICPNVVFTKCIEQAIIIFRSITIKSINKIEIVIPTDYINFQYITNDLLSIKFKQEAILRGEFAKGIDAYILSYFLEE